MKKFSRRRFLKMLGLSSVIAKIKPDILTEIPNTLGTIELLSIDHETGDLAQYDPDEVVAWSPSSCLCGDDGLFITDEQLADIKTSPMEFIIARSKQRCSFCNERKFVPNEICSHCGRIGLLDVPITAWY